MNYFGKISYGIYLYHYIIGAYMDNWATYMLAHGGPAYIFGYWPFYVIKLGTVLVVASLSYNYFETPIINLKKEVFLFEEGSLKNSWIFYIQQQHLKGCCCCIMLVVLLLWLSH